MKQAKSYFIKTFGCQANEADSEKIAGYLEEVGLRSVKKIEKADWVIINTCSVRQSAEDRVLGLVRNLTKSPKYHIPNTTYQIIITGCILYHPLTVLKEKFPKVNHFVKTSEWSEFIKERYKDIKIQGYKVEAKRKDKIHAWVSIMEGCSHFCTYCVVPYARGKEVSRSFQEIVCEAEKLIKQGYREITLLGQNVNSYKPSFSKLLKRLHKIKGIKRISFMTSNPWDLDDNIIQAMKLSKIDRYLHLPIQSGDNGILRKMNRHYTVSQYVKLVEKIRREIPDIKIGTDIIVGFPTETKKAFENTVSLCKKVGFEKAYLAIYSPRPGTAAHKLKDDVPHKEKRRRWLVLEELIYLNNSRT